MSRCTCTCRACADPRHFTDEELRDPPVAAEVLRRLDEQNQRLHRQITSMHRRLDFAKSLAELLLRGPAPEAREFHAAREELRARREAARPEADED